MKTNLKNSSGSCIIISGSASIGRFLQRPPLTKYRKIRVNANVQGDFRNDISETQAGSCKRFQGENLRFRASEEGFWKDF